MFVDSMHWIKMGPRATRAAAPPFERVNDLVERPLDILVLWGTRTWTMRTMDW
jgi:hypothetical protein